MKLTLFLSFVTIVLSGCATMFARSYDDITIQTEPPGVEVYQGVNRIGETPLTHRFNRNTFNRTTLNLRKKGYKTKELELGRALEEKSLFNFGFFLTTGGATSWGIDALTGAMIRHQPDSYFIDLEPDSHPSSSGFLNRRQRAFLVLVHSDSLLREILAGSGEYLDAYFSLLNEPTVHQDFLHKLRVHSDELLAQKDGYDLYRYLETHVSAQDNIK